MLRKFYFQSRLISGRITAESKPEVELDEELCMYMQSLEFFHIAVGAPELFKKAIPSDVTVTPVLEELTIFTSGVSPSAWSMAHLHIPCLSLDDVSIFMRKNWMPMLAILGKAMGSQVDWAVSDEAISDLHSLVHNFFQFPHDEPWKKADTESKRVSPWICVAALCCLWHMRERPIMHKTYSRLMPQNEDIKVREPTQSLLKALKNSRRGMVGVDGMTLEHRLIWRHRLEWFCDSLIGQSELLAPKFTYRIALMGKLMEIFRKNRDRNVLEQMVNELYAFVKGTAFEISESASK